MKEKRKANLLLSDAGLIQQSNLKEDPLTNQSLGTRKITAKNNLFLYQFLILIPWLGFVTCKQQNDLSSTQIYEGPIVSMDSISTILSDSGVLIMEMKAPKQNNYENGNREWGYGFKIKWLNENGQTTRYITADHVYYTKVDNLYKATGNVIVKNEIKNDELRTQELVWNRKEKKIYTDKFVTIKSDDELHTGNGLNSNEEFTEYHIIKPNGTFSLEEDTEQPPNEKKTPSKLKK